MQTLLTSLKPIGNVVLIAATFFTIFGILGVQVKSQYFFFILLLYLVCLPVVFFVYQYLSLQLFKGKFYSCHDVLSTIEVKNKSDCLSNNGKWVNNEYNFDNLARVSIFIPLSLGFLL